MEAARQVVLDYAPRKQLVPFHERTQRLAVIVAHRRFGKTVGCILDLVRQAATLDKPHGRYAYVAPFLSQAKEVAWEYIKRYAQPIIADKNESELWVELVGGSRIRIHGADNPDRLRGAYLDGIVMDEYADMRPSVWGEVIRPMLADRRGWATFIGTPKGRNEFYSLYERAQSDPEWYSLVLRASETGVLPASELQAARGDMTPEQYEQEFECSFEAAIVGSYFGKEIAEAERDGRITTVAHEPDLPVHTAWDLGIGDSTSIWFWQMVGSEVRVIDHYENHSHGLPHYAEVLSKKPYRYEHDWVPHDAKVRELGTGRTRVETLINLKRHPRVVPDHKVMDGINAARVTIPRCWFDRDKCANGLEALRQYRSEYDEKLRTFKDAPRHDWTSHTADAFRYLAMAYRAITEGEKPKDPIKEMLKPKTFDQMMAEHEAERAEE